MFKLKKLKSLFNKLNISNKNPDNSNPDNSNSDNSNPDNSNSDNSNSDNSNSDNSNSVNIDQDNCSYCNKPSTEELWCKECDPFMNIEGWSSGNNEIDKFIKDTICGARNAEYNYKVKFLEWVPFDKFKDINQIGEGGFSKVYSATWIDGPKIINDNVSGIWEKRKSEPIKVALKRLNGSENMSAEYLNEIKILWDLCQMENGCLSFYGMTKDPETEELIIISEYADKGNLRSVLLHNFNNTLWKDKILYLTWIIHGLNSLHKLGYFHKDFHSGNILQIVKPDGDDGNFNASYISDFGLSGPSNKQNSDDKICGVLPYIAPEVLNGEPYSLSSDIYSFGIIMAELSSGRPPFYKRNHDINLALEICNGLRPEFGKGTPEIYKKLAYKCMNANPNQRPTAEELLNIIYFWDDSVRINRNEEKFGYKDEEIKAMFEEADKEIPNISTSYEKNPDAIYSSRLFTFSNLTKPVNSSIITDYLNDEENNKDCQDSRLFDLEISSSLQLKDDINNEEG